MLVTDNNEKTKPFDTNMLHRVKKISAAAAPKNATGTEKTVAAPSKNATTMEKEAAPNLAVTNYDEEVQKTKPPDTTSLPHGGVETSVAAAPTNATGTEISVSAPKKNSTTLDPETPLPEWFDSSSVQCSLPPRDQLLRETNSSLLSAENKKVKIAFLLMEYDNVTFPQVWNRYFGDSDVDSTLYVHFQSQNVPKTMSMPEYKSTFPDDNRLNGLNTPGLVVLKTMSESRHGDLMPTMLRFWKEAIENDEQVTELYALSGSCLPIKPFSQFFSGVQQARDVHSFSASVVNFGRSDRLKASAWGMYTREAVHVMVNDGAFWKNGTCAKVSKGSGATEEVCPAATASQAPTALGPWGTDFRLLEQAQAERFVIGMGKGRIHKKRTSHLSNTRFISLQQLDCNRSVLCEEI